MKERRKTHRFGLWPTIDAASVWVLSSSGISKRAVINLSEGGVFLEGPVSQFKIGERVDLSWVIDGLSLHFVGEVVRAEWASSPQGLGLKFVEPNMNVLTPFVSLARNETIAFVARKLQDSLLTPKRPLR